MTEPLADRWQCRADYTPPAKLIDPRIAIAKHIDWTRPCGNDTDWCLPEPDNYNRAILDIHPHDLSFIKDQVFYYDEYRIAWVSVYYVPEDKLIEFDSYMNKLKPLARWSTKGRKIREHRGLLWAPKNAVLQLNERLHILGYYDTLNKYADTEIFSVRLGLPRDNLNQLLETESPTEILVNRS